MTYNESQRIFTPELKAKLEVIGEVNWCKNGFPNNTNDLYKELLGYNTIITGRDSPFISRDVVKSNKDLALIVHSRASIRKYIDFSIFDLGIKMANSAYAIAPFVAEMALGFMISAARRIDLHAENIKIGGWKSNKIPPTITIFNKNIGIVGFGFVARELCKMLKPFSPIVYVFDPYVEDTIFRKYNVKRASLREIFLNCDIVTIHAGLTEETKGMINKDYLSLLHSNAIIINTARGAIIHTEDLLEISYEKNLFLYLDVYEDEPLSANHPLRKYERAVLTPHIAGPSDDALPYLGKAVIENITAFLEGKCPKGLLTKDMALRST